MFFGRKGYRNLEELYEENEALVYTFMRDYTKDENLVQELSQRLWIKVWENFDKFRDKEKKDAQAYMRAMAHNVAADYFKEVKNEKECWGNMEWISSDQAMEEIEAISERELNDLQQECLCEAAEILTEEERYLLHLKYEKRLSSRAIGELTGRSAAVARVNLQRTRDKLRDEAYRIMRRKEHEI